jgi:DNA-binding NarL/FixJ family response regulator
MQILWENPGDSQLFNMLHANCPDILLLDINLKRMTGIEIIHHIHEHNLPVRVIIVSMYDHKSYIKEFIEYGAMGYLLKNECGRDLINAVRAVMRGEQFYCSGIAQVLLGQANPKPQKAYSAPVEVLAGREKEILKLVSREYNNQEIADKLCLSVRTVENYKRRLFQKLGVKSSLGLVRYTLENNLM